MKHFPKLIWFPPGVVQVTLGCSLGIQIPSKRWSVRIRNTNREQACCRSKKEGIVGLQSDSGRARQRQVDETDRDSTAEGMRNRMVGEHQENSKASSVHEEASWAGEEEREESVLQAARQGKKNQGTKRTRSLVTRFRRSRSFSVPRFNPQRLTSGSHSTMGIFPQFRV
jgi:hypothetical protein